MDLWFELAERVVCWLFFDWFLCSALEARMGAWLRISLAAAIGAGGLFLEFTPVPIPFQRMLIFALAIGYAVLVCRGALVPKLLAASFGMAGLLAGELVAGGALGICGFSSHLADFFVMTSFWVLPVVRAAACGFTLLFAARRVGKGFRFPGSVSGPLLTAALTLTAGVCVTPYLADVLTPLGTHELWLAILFFAVGLPLEAFLFISCRVGRLYETEGRMTGSLCRLSASHDRLLREADALRSREHDFRKHLAALGGIGAENNCPSVCAYVQQVLEEDPPDLPTRRTGIAVLDALLSRTAVRANEASSRMTVDAPVLPPLEADDPALSVIFGNLLDNALEGVLRVREGERFISIRAEVFRDMARILIRNARAADEGDPDKTRRRKGYGLRNVRRAVRRATGMLRINESQGEYEAEVWLPVRRGTETEETAGSEVVS